MDKLERTRERRDEYESAMDEAERLRDEYHREVVKLHRSGMSLREIADGLGISHQRVHQIVAPLEERSNARRGRGTAAGAAGVALALVVAGALWFARPDGQPVVQRSSSTAQSEASSRASEPCLTHLAERRSRSPLTAATQCQGAVVVLDPETGRILARVSGPAPGFITTIDAQQQQDLQDYLEDLERR